MATKKCKYCGQTFAFDKSDIRSVATGGMAGMIYNGIVVMAPTHKEYLLCPNCGKANTATSEEGKAFLKAFIIFTAMLLIVGIIWFSTLIKYNFYDYRCGFCGDKHISDVKYEYKNGTSKRIGRCKKCHRYRQVYYVSISGKYY